MRIYGLPKLLEKFPSCVVVSNNFGFMALADDKMNMSRYHDKPIVVEPENKIVVSEGDFVDLFDNVKVQVFETPGHHPSCLTFELGDCLFTGDAYIPGQKVVTNLPKGDKNLAAKSLERILKHAEGNKVMAGHEVIAQ